MLQRLPGLLHEHGAPDLVVGADAAIGDHAVTDLRPDAVSPPVPGKHAGEPLVVALPDEGERVDVDAGAVAAVVAVADVFLIAVRVVPVVGRAAAPVPDVAVVAPAESLREVHPFAGPVVSLAT